VIAELRSCKDCGALFTATVNRKIYCSLVCCNRAVDRTKTRTMYSHVCLHCRGEFRNRVKTARFCSRRCSGLANAGERAIRRCVVCGAHFEGYRRETCSRPCFAWHSRYPGTPRSLACGQCGGTFVPTDTKQIYCSTNCRRSAVEARRRGRVIGAPYERVVPLDIFKRDGWKCHLCGGQIDPALRNYHPMMASIDHIVPIKHPDYALHGHTRQNLAAAHFVCNIRKRNRLVGTLPTVASAG
jgi:HNH endonuclease